MKLFDDYDYDLAVRWGEGNPPLAGLFEAFKNQGSVFETTLRRLEPYINDLREIPLKPIAERPDLPHWDNGFLPALDIISLHGLIREWKPRKLIEIGSGNSTMVSHHARSIGGLDMEIVSIDPYPRADIDRLCDRMVRQPLEHVDLTLFDELASGDILFFDGSHRTLQNSDVTVFFLEILPRIPAGTLIQIHDICIPYDYPSEWRDRAYSEQYMLALLLLFAPEKWEILCPNLFTAYTGIAGRVFEDFWNEQRIPTNIRHGGSFWMRKGFF